MTDIKRPYESIVVASYINHLCDKKAIDVNLTKIQKLLYIAYGICLTLHNERLTDEKPKLWPYGPVFPTAINKFKKDGYIDKNSLDIDEKSKEILEYVVNKYGQYSARILSEWSHEYGSPWQQLVYIGCSWNTEMPDDLIKGYFQTNLYNNHQIQ